MAKNVERSNEAHRRLKHRAASRLGKEKHAAKKWTYHDRVVSIQNARGCILSKSERMKIYKSS